MQLSTLISPLAAASAASTSAFSALIWWLVPLTGVIGALGYILWVTQFKRKFEQGTARSVNQFERFQNSFRDSHQDSDRDSDRDSYRDSYRDNEPKSK